MFLCSHSKQFKQYTTRLFIEICKNIYLPLRVVTNYIVILLKVTYVKRLIKHSEKRENYRFPCNYYLFHATLCQCSKVKHLKKYCSCIFTTFYSRQYYCRKIIAAPKF